MIDEMQKLKLILQLLALPAVGQMRLLETDWVRIKALTEAFNASRCAVLSSPGGALIPEQARALMLLDAQLERLCHGSAAPFCCESSMRTNNDWRRVRLMAREALIQFQWMLELPPQTNLREYICLN